MTARLLPPLIFCALILMAIIGLGWMVFDAGVSHERERWQKAALIAEAEAREQEQADTTASEGARDAAAQEAADASADARDQKTQTIETIRYVYRDRETACPDAAPLPDSVRDSLGAAYDALTSSAR